MAGCPDLCSKLRTLPLHGSALPFCEDLIAHLPDSRIEGFRGWHLGRWEDVRSRRDCPFCRLVVAAVEENDASGTTRIDPEKDILVVLFPNESALRLSYPSRLGTQLAFVADAERHVVAPDNARRVSSLPVNLDLIKGWLKTCNEQHGCISNPDQYGNEEPRQGASRETDHSNFRVLDLVDNCLRNVPLDVRYVALSYVWGQIPMFRLQRDNYQLLTSPGGLNHVRHQLPQTINDTIDFVQGMGEMYLWIDALCLCQDDAADVEKGIKMMNSIFQGSYFTIVAGSGRDGNGGLPGISNTPRSTYSQPITHIRPDLSMSIIHSVDWHLSRSVYNQRGWTLQELVLPQRTVIFIHDKVFFRCQHANWSEDTWSDRWTFWLDDDDSNIARVPPHWSTSLSGASWAYQKLCENYSRRQLRNDGDALRAMAGLCRPLFAGMQTVGVEGLPGYHLDRFLLFISQDAGLRRRSQFASFSWAGWEGGIMWPREAHVIQDDGGEEHSALFNIRTWFRKNRLVHWCVFQPGSQKPEPLSSFRYRRGPPIIDLWNLYTQGKAKETRSPEELCIGHTAIPDWDQPESYEAGLDLPDLNLPGLGMDAANMQTGYEPILSVTRNTGELSPKLRDPMTNSIPHNRMTQPQERKSMRSHFQALGLDASHHVFRHERSAIGSLEDRIRLQNDGRTKAWVEKTSQISELGQAIPRFPPYAILQFEAIVVRLIVGDLPHTDASDTGIRKPVFLLLGETNIIVGSLHVDNSAFATTGEVVELAVISRCQTPTMGSALFSVLPAEVLKEPMERLWVIHIVWIDGVAERRGIGQIFESALGVSMEPGLEFKQVLLG